MCAEVSANARQPIHNEMLDFRVGWTGTAGARWHTTQGERETSESCRVCQTFASLFGLWILIEDASSTLQPGRLEIQYGTS